MQHIVHIFIGDELVSLRDQFATIYRSLNPNIPSPYFTALSFTKKSDESISLRCDENGDSQDTKKFDNDTRLNVSLVNYFSSMFQRKVTIEHQGNHTLLIQIWSTLFMGGISKDIILLLNALKSCSANIKVEINGFTHEAVSCFVPNHADRFAPEYYKEHFEQNLASMLPFKSNLNVFRLIENRNYNGVSLNFTIESMARVLAEFSSILCRNYLNINHPIADPETPFESFGISAIKFDRQYILNYLRHKVILDKMSSQGVERPNFNITTLSTKTNPIIQDILNKIQEFHKTNVTDEKAKGFIKGDQSAQKIVSGIDNDLKKCRDDLASQIDTLFKDSTITFFEREALLSLLLAEDNTMFQASAVTANELTIDDIIDDSTNFFIGLDGENLVNLNDVRIHQIKNIRNRMRNIAIANREREERLEKLNVIKQNIALNTHIEGNVYRFNGKKFNLNLEIDTEPLEIIYKPHNVRETSIDLRTLFGKIRNQGEQGSCSAFAITSVIETLRNDKNQYSPAFLYYNARALKNSTNSDTGSSLYHVLKVAIEHGSCIEEKMPYDPDIFDVSPSEDAFENAKECRVLEAQTVDLGKDPLSSIKSALSDGYPVIIASKIFDSFSESKSGFIKHPSVNELNGNSSNTLHGTHAMVVCGFSDEQKVFVVRNSWGTSFGDNGYCYIPYSYAEKYFLQACIITKLSQETPNKTTSIKKTLNFDITDANIEAAILQNLIYEDNLELSNLTVLAANLKSQWSQNVAKLGNVNNQTNIIDSETRRIEKKIQGEKNVLSDLEAEYNNKIKWFKKNQIITLISLIISSISWIMILLFLNNSFWIWFFTILTSLATLWYGVRIGYNWRAYRQGLRDEIKAHKDEILRLKNKKELLPIKAHIHGTIIREIGNLRASLQDRKQKLSLFNEDMTHTYHEIGEDIKSMKPDIPYPFMTLLCNENIDKYFDVRKDRIGDGFDFDALFREFNPKNNLLDQIKNDLNITNAINRDIKNFSTSLLITNKDGNKWQFLPDVINHGAMFKSLDERSIPFSAFQADFPNHEKYIFFCGADSSSFSQISRHFGQEPRPINDIDPDSITLLSISRFKL